MEFKNIPLIGVAKWLIGVKDNGNGTFSDIKFLTSNLPQLIGVKKGFNLNPANQTISYSGLTGGTFNPGDVITDFTTSFTAVVVTDNGTNSMVVKAISGLLGSGNTFDNGSGVSAIFSTNYTVKGELITLINGSGSTRYVIYDVMVTNAKDNTGADLGSVAASGFAVHEQDGRLGAIIAFDRSSSMSVLTTKNKFINSLSANISNTISSWRNLRMNTTNDTVGSYVYPSIIGPQGVASTCDVYIFGYLLP